MKAEKPGSDLMPTLSILGAVFLWGSSFSAMRIALQDLPPTAVLSARYGIAFFCMIPFYKKFIPETLHKKDIKIILSMVLFEPCLYFIFESNALVYTTSAQAGIICATLPLMVAVAAWLFLAEQIVFRTVAGLVLSIAGIILLTSFQGNQEQASNPVLGNLLEVAAMASACGYMILVKHLSSRYTAWSLTGFQALAGAVFFIPGARFLFTADPGIWKAELIFVLIFLGTGVSLAAFVFYNWGISRIEASRASVFVNLIPVIAVFLGWLVLDETLNPAQSLAALIVIAGVFISTRK